MYDSKKICHNIKKIYTDIGECGINVKVEYDDEEKIWVVELKKGKLELRSHLEPDEAERCMQGKQCVSLGLQVAELKASADRISGKTG